MKNILLKFGFCSLLFSGFSAEAKDLTFTLDCQWSVSATRPATEPDYQIVKTATKKSGKWKNEFTLVATSRTKASEVTTYNLEEASGDADYLVYQAQNDASGILGWITIQNKFKWASIDTSEGNYDCK